MLTSRINDRATRQANLLIPLNLISDQALRELIIPFGRAGYVALFEIENESIVAVVAVRHQLEDEYH